MNKKGKQEELPGMEARDFPEIEQAADRYREIRDERCELSKREADAKSALIQVMKNLGRSFYQYSGLKVQLEITDNVKVKSSEADDDEPTGNFRQTRRKNEVKQSAEDLIKQGEELIEQQQQAESEEEAARDMNPWPYQGDRELSNSYQAEWFEGLSEEEQEKFFGALCSCGHIRDYHPGDEADGKCSLCVNCKGYHCRTCKTQGGHIATCEHYMLGEGTPVQGGSIRDLRDKETPVQDDFTAPICDQCKRIDGAHTKECSKSNELRFEDYENYARAHYKSNHKSHARKMELSKLKDEEIREWKQQQASSLVEAAIDR